MLRILFTIMVVLLLSACVRNHYTPGSTEIDLHAKEDAAFLIATISRKPFSYNFNFGVGLRLINLDTNSKYTMGAKLGDDAKANYFKFSSDLLLKNSSGLITQTNRQGIQGNYAILKVRPGRYKITGAYATLAGKITVTGIAAYPVDRQIHLLESKNPINRTFTVKRGQYVYIGSVHGQPSPNFSKDNTLLSAYYDAYARDIPALKQQSPILKSKTIISIK